MLRIITYCHVSRQSGQNYKESMGFTRLKCSVNHISLFAEKVESIAVLGPLAERAKAYVDYYSTHDAFRLLLEHAPVGGWSRLLDCIPESVRRDNEWYNDFLLTAGIDDAIAARLYDDGFHTVLFGVHHAVDQAPFTLSQIGALGQLG